MLYRIEIEFEGDPVKEEFSGVLRDSRHDGLDIDFLFIGEVWFPARLYNRIKYFIQYETHIENICIEAIQNQKYDGYIELEFVGERLVSGVVK